jgi:hypothetical protein
LNIRRHLPTMTGNFSCSPFNFGKAILRFKQSSETLVIFPSARGGEIWPSGCGHAGPGLSASILEPGTGTKGRGGLKRFSPLVSCAYGIPRKCTMPCCSNPTYSTLVASIDTWEAPAKLTSALVRRERDALRILVIGSLSRVGGG